MTVPWNRDAYEYVDELQEYIIQLEEEIEQLKKRLRDNGLDGI